GSVFMFSFADLVHIHGLWNFHVIARSIIGAFARMLHTARRTTPLHFPAAIITLGEMLVTFGVCTVNHLCRNGAAVFAGRYERCINGIHIYRKSIVKQLPLSIKILTFYYLTNLDYNIKQLVNIIESFF